MQTFLPYPSFIDSARCLDSKRLGKQRVEAKQILLALGVCVGEHHGNPMSSWRNHPAVRMWEGHENWLAIYAVDVCSEWRRRGFNDTLYDQFVAVRWRLVGGFGFKRRPRWIGDEAFHASHRSNLLRKDPVWYGRLGWAEDDSLPYIWPVAGKKEVLK